MRLVDGLRVLGGNNVWGSLAFSMDYLFDFWGRTVYQKTALRTTIQSSIGFLGQLYLLFVISVVYVCLCVCVSVWVYHKECFPGVLSRH